MEDRSIHFKLGTVAATLENLSERFEKIEKDVAEVKSQVNGWQNKATGAIAVISIIGSFVLYLGHDLFVVIKTKLGF